MDTVYSLEVWVPDGERWRWSAIGAYPTLDMAVAVGEGFLSVKPYRVRRVTDVGDGFHDFLAEEVFANALTGRMRLLREKFGHEGRGYGLPSRDGIISSQCFHHYCFVVCYDCR